MIFIGDVHRNLEKYLEMREQLPESIQVGDFGFRETPLDSVSLSIVTPDENHKMIRGNHDDPDLAHQHPNCLSDWGYDEDRDLFWLSGGYSIDYKSRKQGFDWWEDEELSYLEIQKALDAYAEIKPAYFVSHEAPSYGTLLMFKDNIKHHYPNRTQQGLDAFYVRHEPKIWVFGHYHERRRLKIGNTTFICCGQVQRDKSVGVNIRKATVNVKEI